MAASETTPLLGVTTDAVTNGSIAQHVAPDQARASDSLDEVIVVHSHHHDDHHHGDGSNTSTFFNIVISIVGAGVLGLPYTFRRSGWVFTMMAVCSSALLSYHCMIKLIHCRKLIAERHASSTAPHPPIRTYGDLGMAAAGRAGQQAVDVLVVISQGGCCVAYLIFIAENLASILTPIGLPANAKTTVILMLAPFQVFLAWVRSLAGLAPFSILADAANLAAMLIVMRDDLISTPRPPPSSLHAFTGVYNMPFAIGVAIYCYEGFALVLPLEASMKDGEQFPTVLAFAFAAITTLYTTFGLIGYCAFGEHTQEIITLNLPTDWTTSAIKLALCVGLFFTFPVMMQPVHEIAERRLALSPAFQSRVQPSPRLRYILLRTIRASVVALVAFIAIEVPGFATFISLVGSTVCALLAFVLPAIFHLRLLGSSTSTFSFISNTLLILFGVVFAAHGFLQSILDTF